MRARNADSRKLCAHPWIAPEPGSLCRARLSGIWSVAPGALAAVLFLQGLSGGRGSSGCGCGCFPVSGLHVLAVLQEPAGLVFGCHFHSFQQGQDLVPRNGLQAEGHVIAVVSVQGHAFLAPSVPVAQGVGTGAAGDGRIGHQTSVLQHMLLAVFLADHG